MLNRTKFSKLLKEVKWIMAKEKGMKKKKMKKKPMKKGMKKDDMENKKDVTINLQVFPCLETDTNEHVQTLQIIKKNLRTKRSAM